MAEKKILVVEDSALVVLSLEGLFEDMNWKMEGPAARLDEALELAETTRADIALLDINLDGENSWPAAERLRDRGIPIVFATGYDGESLLPKSFAGTPVVMKPFRSRNWRRCFARSCRSTSRRAEPRSQSPKAARAVSQFRPSNGVTSNCRSA